MKLSVKSAQIRHLDLMNERARPVLEHRTGCTHREDTSMSTKDPTDWDTPASPDDLQWWLSSAPLLGWTWAKSYAESAPHWYVRGGSTPGFTTADSRRVSRVVRTFGEAGKFYRQTNLYLFTEDRARKFWCIQSDPPQDNVRIVNLAYADRVYGPQEDFDEQRLAALRLGGER